MEILKSIESLKTYRENYDQVAFVPTMGNLHEGHISLTREALKKHRHCIVSIFVNPLQFGPNEDFDAYPRTLEDDTKKLQILLEEFPGASIAVFAPENSNIMFPKGYATKIRNEKFEGILCGKSRPGHFEGVLTVVHKLFKIVNPTSAFFGLKDFQQFHLIKSMCHDLEMDVELVGCPIVRNENGLALSSRNNYLSDEDKQLALKLSRSIHEVLDLTKGKTWQDCKETVSKKIEGILLDKNYEWDYLEIRNKESLETPQDENSRFVVLGAMYVNGTRLIDNMFTE